MIDQLNNDCQLCIINSLDLRSQLALWKATKNFSVRLNDNICWAWRNNKYFLAWIIAELEDDTEVLDQLLSTIGETLQSPGLLYITLKQLKLLVNYKFPNVHKLECEINDPYPWKTQPEIYQLHKIFPELNSLKIWGGGVNGFRFQKFNKLRKLELWHCFGFGDSLTGHETLEELIIDINKTDNIFYAKTLKNFPKLHTIAFSLEDSSPLLSSTYHYYFRDTLRERFDDITELSFNNSITFYKRSGLKLPKHMKRLSVINDKEFTVEKLLNLISGKLLEQLDLVDSPTFSNEIQLWKTVTVCPSLQILNVSGMKIKNDFFELSRHHMEQALARRSVPLTLHCHNTGVDRNLIDKNFKHPKLNVSFVPLAMKTVYQGYVQIHFRPLNKQTK